ncbi:MAG: hypothetical protein KBS75_04485 [Bacteroidales bacterium]|nr:hypothetical protein [Candidatus Equimonas faecalis]
MNKYPTYSVSIRTLGTAGKKYQETLNSVARQTVKPEKVLVYIPHGYALPKETIGVEEYVRCDKGMVTQRSQPFDEITSEYILFLDDDLSFEANFVQKLFDGLLSMDGDCISPDIYRVQNESTLIKIRNFLGGTTPHYDNKWAFKIKKNAHYSYNNHSARGVLLSQSAAGACILCKKSAYHAIRFQEERWIDQISFSFGEDLLFSYKLYKHGYKVLISYDAQIIHLDAGSGHEKNKAKMAYASAFCRYLIWHRIIYSVQESHIDRAICLFYLYVQKFMSLLLSIVIIIVNHNLNTVIASIDGENKAKKYIKSSNYKQLPRFF